MASDPSMKTLLSNQLHYLISLGQAWKRNTSDWSNAYGFIWPAHLEQANLAEPDSAAHPEESSNPSEDNIDNSNNATLDEIALDENDAALVEAAFNLMDNKDHLSDQDEVERLLGQLEESSIEPLPSNALLSFFTAMSKAIA